MNVRTKLDKLEQKASQYYQILRLPDGSEVPDTDNDAIEAMFAAIDGEEHWLLPALQIDAPTAAYRA